MATDVNYEGSSYRVAAIGERSYAGAAKIDGLLIALAQNVLQHTGGSFTLSADVDWGNVAGHVLKYIKSSAGTIADAGFLRLNKTDTIKWRNNANSGNVTLDVSSDRLRWEGVNLVGISTTDTLTNKTMSGASNTFSNIAYASLVLTGGIVNADINAAAAIAFSKLNTTLGAEADFGGSFGLKALYLKTQSANPASVGVVRGANNETLIAGRNAGNDGDLTFGANGNNDWISSAGIIAPHLRATTGACSTVGTVRNENNTDGPSWRNAANDGNLPLKVNASDRLQFNSVDVPTKSSTDTLTNKTISTADNTIQSGAASDGQVLTADGAGGTAWESPASAPDQSYEINNLGLAASVAASALTVALKTKGGSDPSAGSPVKIGFRNATAATGQYAQRSVTGSLSVVVSSGSTLGHASAVPDYIYVYALDNSGTVELAISSTLYDEGSIVSTTAEGGAGAADSRYTIYSTTARANVPIRLIGRLQSSQATAGTWATAIAEIALTFEKRPSIIYGTANTSNIGGLTNTGAMASAGAQTLTFTPGKTGRYKVYTTVHAYNTSASTQFNVQVAASSGSPTTLFQQVINADSGAGSISRQMHPYTIYWLVAGTSYTFEVQYTISSGTMVIRNDRPANGAVMIAEQFN